MNLIDCHTHTQFSMDSEADINLCIKKAMDIGLSAYAITDHCECSTWYPKNHYSDTKNFDYFNYSEDFNNSLSAVTELKEKYNYELYVMEPYIYEGDVVSSTRIRKEILNQS